MNKAFFFSQTVSPRHFVVHSAIVLSETEAVRIEALKDFTDTFGVKRKIGGGNRLQVICDKS